MCYSPWGHTESDMTEQTRLLDGTRGCDQRQLGRDDLEPSIKSRIWKNQGFGGG